MSVLMALRLQWIRFGEVSSATLSSILVILCTLIPGQRVEYPPDTDTPVARYRSFRKIIAQVSCNDGQAIKDD